MHQLHQNQLLVIRLCRVVSREIQEKSHETLACCTDVCVRCNAIVIIFAAPFVRRWKDIVTESESFDVERFIPLLQKYIRRANPYIRQLLVSTQNTAPCARRISVTHGDASNCGVFP